jgi:hypothetical protein
MTPGVARVALSLVWVVASRAQLPFTTDPPIAYVASVKPNDAVDPHGFPNTRPGADSALRQ